MGFTTAMTFDTGYQQVAQEWLSWVLGLNFSSDENRNASHR